MKRFLLALLASAFLLTAGAQTLLPIRDSIGKLSISVDPRMELLGTVFLLADYKFHIQGVPYCDRVQAYFSPFADAGAVKFARGMWRYNMSLGWLAGQMLAYSDLPDMKRQYPYFNMMNKAHPKDLRHYNTLLKRFAEKSRFSNFWTANELFYRQVIAWCKSQVGDIDVVGLLESYFNMKQESYDIVLCPLFGYNSFGPRLPGSDGLLKIYALISVPQNLGGIVADGGFDLSGLLFHEFGHSFVNPFTEKYADLVAQSSDRFEPIRDKMKPQSYWTWDACVSEHIVRAVGVRLAEITGGPAVAENSLRYEEGRYFGYIRPLVEKLREYEVLRDSAGISFGEYVPELLKVFNEAELYKPVFPGSVNAVLSGDVIYVCPTAGDEAPRSTGYVRWLVDQIKMRGPSWKSVRLVADSVAVKMPLDSCNIVCYGTVESNLLLARYRSKLPFQAEPGAIIADRRYDDPGVRLIACVPNPENPELGMAVYTAIDERRIIDINNVFHGPDDFCIFTDRDHILSRGYFEKRGTEWRFPQPKPSAD